MSDVERTALLDFMPLLLGFVVTFLSGLGVKDLMDFATKKIEMPAPSASLETEWEVLRNAQEGGTVLGFLERILFFGALWMGAQLAIGAWLAFKVASKWQAWSTVVSVPKEIEGLDPIRFLIARRAWGSHLNASFLVGTLANILVAGLGVAVGRYIAHATLTCGAPLT